ncbi:MAG TPA: type II toxin-antitoxin system RelE/ParE family toxin [Thermoanaerobaculia bacterium]|nr:type II toxin-antitoxin system RelE/ParE family toxin [Thermoanaerobaculia bacterium]
MNLQLVVRPAARRDLAEQSEYIARDSPSAALRFLDAAKAAFGQLRELPATGKRRQFSHPALSGIRSWPIPGFDRHLIFYRPTDQRIDILRVIHSARDLTRIFGSEETAS